MNVLKQRYCLVLNSVWQPIGTLSLQKGVTALCSTEDGENMAAKALDLEYALDEDGKIDWYKNTKALETSLEDWFNLPLRDFDIPLHTATKTFRAPVVIIAKNYSKMNFRKIKPTKRNLAKQYGNRCIWTGRELSMNEISREHMKAKYHGGDDSWLNVAIADKALNSERGHTPIEEWKYKPQYKLFEPKSKPMSSMIGEPQRPEWLFFLY